MLLSPYFHTDPSGRCLEDFCIGETMLAMAAIDAATQYFTNDGCINWAHAVNAGIVGGLLGIEGRVLFEGIASLRFAGELGLAAEAGELGSSAESLGLGADAAETTVPEVTWNNGWRTVDGKFASPLGTGRAGGSAEMGVWDAIEAKPGWTVDRGPIAVRDASDQLRYYDGVAYSPTGKVIGLEVKSGGAYRTAAQRTFDTTLNSSTSNVAKGVGQSTGVTVQRSTLIKVPGL